MPQVELQDPELDATDPHTRLLLLLAEHWKREAMLHKSRADTQREELLRAWFVLKEFGHHPGRTDDTLSECTRRALAAETRRWEEAMRLTWQMVDPLKPAGTPGSYARGQDSGIVAALTTLRANLKTPNVGAKRAAEGGPLERPVVPL